MRPHWLLALIAAIVLPGIFVAWMIWGGYEPNLPQSTFQADGPVGKLQKDLFWIIFWSATVIFVVIEGIFVYAIFRFPRRPNQPIPPQTHGHQTLEIGWTIAPAIVLAVVAVPTVSALWQIYNVPEEKAGLAIEVRAHQWWWEFKYPNQGVVTANEVHMPVGTRVHFTLHSDDVIHSFWIPKLGGKLDVIPNHSNVIWLQGDEPGEYYGQCAEFCGEAHAFMRFRAVVDTQADFDKWVAAQKAPASAAATGAATTGEALFMGKGACTACHTVAGTNAKGVIGPNLTHVGSRTTIAAGIMPNDHENLVKWLSDPGGIKPGNKMATVIGKSIKLTPDEVGALATYVQGLK
ncbi:MAG: cytochrome c oxidase subunit II [Dehalococcoidia bacterium]|nr:cytochrome c oxidase subunit II [Dehalococcoidia bacterium]